MSKRLAALRGLMKEKGFDAVLVTKSENHLYMCGFNNPDGTLLITADAAYALQDFRYIEAAKREIDSADFEVVMPQVRVGQWVREALAASGCRVLAYEDKSLTCRELESFKKAVDCCELVPCGDIFTDLRILKDEKEVDCIVRAQRIAEKSFEELLPLITYDCTETFLAAQLEFLMKKNGSEGISFETIAVSGTNSSSPHGVPRNVKIEKGFMTFDFGAMIGGYHSDMTRTVVIGKADEAMKRLYSKVLEAQRAVLDVIGEGESLYKMDRIARDIIDACPEYKGAFGHSLGHGVGLEIHEAPTLSSAAGDGKLKAGHVVTVEPGIYLEGKYGCRIEDMVYITKGGAVNLTKCPKELIEI